MAGGFVGPLFLALELLFILSGEVEIDSILPFIVFSMPAITLMLAARNAARAATNGWTDFVDTISEQSDPRPILDEIESELKTPLFVYDNTFFTQHWFINAKPLQHFICIPAQSIVAADIRVTSPMSRHKTERLYFLLESGEETNVWTGNTASPLLAALDKYWPHVRLGETAEARFYPPRSLAHEISDGIRHVIERIKQSKME